MIRFRLKQNGFSLLEVLIASFILSFGLLGLIFVFLKSHLEIENYYWGSLAASCLISMSEVDRIAVSEHERIKAEYQEILPNAKFDLEEKNLKICWNGRVGQRCLSIERFGSKGSLQSK